MKYSTIRYHLRPYKILERRKTTINHAFASAIAPYDEYDDSRIRKAVEVLEQDPDQSLRCVYCDENAQTWDHVHGTVKNSKFSGHGHRVGNLVPTCRTCNSSKGNKDWKVYLSWLCNSKGLHEETYCERENRIANFLSFHAYNDSEPEDSPEYLRLQEIRNLIFELMKEADGLAEQIRSR